MEPFGGVLRPSIGSDQRFVIFYPVAVRRSCLAVRGLKLGQIVSKWPETSCDSSFGYFERSVVFVWFCQDLMLEAALPVCSRMRLHIAFDVDEAK